MKLKVSLIITFLALFLLSSSIFSQHKKDLESLYVTVITLHGVEGIDFEEWLKVEKEYFEKVTSKIDIILEHEVLVSYFSDDLSEIKVINVFKTWDDIEFVNSLRETLIENAWPNEAERNAFFEKQNSFYTNYHSDEIYITSSLSKKMSIEEKSSIHNPMVYYMDTNILSDYDNREAYKLYEDYLREVIYKNSYIKAYHPYRHYWGDDSREFIEIYVVNSLSNLEKALDMNKTLFELFMPDQTKRKGFIRSFKKAVSGHKNDIYKNVPSLSK